MPWRLWSVIESRKEFCIFVLESGASVSAACRAFGISRKTGYKWLHRYGERGSEGLLDRSRRPRHSPGMMIKGLEDRIVEIKQQYPYWGPRKIHRLASRDCDEIRAVSVSSISRVLARRGLVTPRQQPVTYPVVGRFERGSPNELWQMDLKVTVPNSEGKRVYIAGLLDDYSRYALGLWLLWDITDESVLSCWIKTACRYGLPAQTLTDHGAQFRQGDDATSAFHTYLWACQVQHIQGRVGHPQTQGKIERFWRTLQCEITPQLKDIPLDRWPELLEQWRQQYNTIRPHQSIGDTPPSSRYRSSDRPYEKPDPYQKVGKSESIYRHVNDRGYISLGGQLHMVGRGFKGWTVEIRAQGNGYWHIYFRHHFVREIILTKPIQSVTHVPEQV